LFSRYLEKFDQVWRPLAAKRGNLAVSAQRHVKAPFISYLQTSDVFIRKVSNNQVIRDFLEKYTKWKFLLTYYTNFWHIGFRRVKVAILTKFGMENTNLVFVLLYLL